MDYSIEDFVRLINYKSSIIRDEKKTLLEKYNSKELYEQFLQDTLTLLEDERPFFILDDSFRSKIYEVIGIYRFEFRDKKLNDMANQIITELNGMTLYTTETENNIIDEYICMQEDVRELVFSDLKDFIDTIAKDADFYEAISSSDLTKIDDIIFIGGTNFFLAIIPKLYQDKKVLELTIERAKKIKSKLGIKTYKKQMGATRVLNYLKEETKKNQA